jgi:hypothetical protein
VRFRLGHEQLVAHEAKRQQCLGAADAKNFRRYIKSARDKEANFKADAARYGARKIDARIHSWILLTREEGKATLQAECIVKFRV